MSKFPSTQSVFHNFHQIKYRLKQIIEGVLLMEWEKFSGFRISDIERKENLEGWDVGGLLGFVSPHLEIQEPNF